MVLSCFNSNPIVLQICLDAQPDGELCGSNEGKFASFDCLIFLKLFAVKESFDYHRVLLAFSHRPRRKYGHKPPSLKSEAKVVKPAGGSSYRCEKNTFLMTLWAQELVSCLIYTTWW